MDLATLFQAPIVERIGTADISFPRVPSRDLAVLAAKLKGQWRAADAQNATEQGLNQTQKFRVMQEVDRREVSTPDLIGYIESPQGSEDVIRLSLKRSKPPIEETDIDSIIDAMDAIAITHLALRLTGIADLQPKAQAAPATPKATDGGPLAFGTTLAEGAVTLNEARGFHPPEEPPAGAAVISTGSPPQPSLNSTSDAT